MKFIDSKGRTKKCPPLGRYIIDWSGPSRSKIQEKVKKCLEPLWSGMAVFEEFPVVGTRLTLDFYNSTLGIAIEVQGNQHLKHIPYFHGKKMNTFTDQLVRDKMKEKFCEDNSIRLLEIFEKDDISTAFLQKLIYGR